MFSRSYWTPSVKEHTWLNVFDLSILLVQRKKNTFLETIPDLTQGVLSIQLRDCRLDRLKPHYFINSNFIHHQTILGIFLSIVLRAIKRDGALLWHSSTNRRSTLLSGPWLVVRETRTRRSEVLSLFYFKFGGSDTIKYRHGLLIALMEFL